MFRQVVFNVGGALSTYFEAAGKKVIVDLGSSKEFNPVIDFWVPLYTARKSAKYTDGRFLIDQCIISHPHNDHMSAIMDFNKNFCPTLLTCPNDNFDKNGRVVDPRYNTDECCKGESILSSDDEKHYQVKTSWGHIYFSSGQNDRLNVEIQSDIRDVIRKFA